MDDLQKDRVGWNPIKYVKISVSFGVGKRILWKLVGPFGLFPCCYNFHCMMLTDIPLWINVMDAHYKHLIIPLELLGIMVIIRYELKELNSVCIIWAFPYSLTDGSTKTCIISVCKKP